MSGKHSTVLRGLESSGLSPMFQGRFGRMFRSLPAARFGGSEEHNLGVLRKLGNAMSATFDPPKDGLDDEESGIPALYTYLGQFMDHDITFDPESSLQKQNDPDALTDFRTPAFDLDNVYGRGPDDQPYMYDGSAKFLLGEPLSGGSQHARDLVRSPNGRALIGDPRNDENSIVSQLQGLFQRFHNRVVTEHPHLDFPSVQQFVRFHYQYVILHDFLPRVIHSSVIQALQTAGRYDRRKLEFFHWKNDPFMPVEFSVAAYRLGHSMIRPGYQLNDKVLLPIFPVPSKKLPDGLTGFRPMNPHWAIDWGRFIDIDIRTYNGTKAENKKRLQFAYRIDTSLVNPLHHLPPQVAANPASLAERNLIRALRLGLPSGQDVARAMGVTPLADKDILIGKAVSPLPNRNILSVSPSFADKCPLWTYILAEAMKFQEPVKIPVKESVVIDTPRLGPVGGRIVAEVFLGLMFGDANSMLNIDPNFMPMKPGFALKDLVSYALGF